MVYKCKDTEPYGTSTPRTESILILNESLTGLAQAFKYGSRWCQHNVQWELLDINLTSHW